MTNQLMKLSELGDILGYADNRSIEGWCKKNMIPIIPAGKLKYVMSSFVEDYFKNILSNKTSADTQEIKDVKSKLVTNKIIKSYSKASQSFLDNIKSK